MFQTGLLSAHTLTSDDLFINLANQLGSRLAYAFTFSDPTSSQPYGLPASDIDLVTNSTSMPGGALSLAEVTSLQACVVSFHFSLHCSIFFLKFFDRFYYYYYYFIIIWGRGRFEISKIRDFCFFSWSSST